MKAHALTVAAALASAGAAATELASTDSMVVATGARVYAQHCAACHGANGEGAPDWKRPNAAGELPAPPHGPDGHTWRHSDAMLARMIARGWRDPFNKTSRLTMPAYQDILTAAEIEAVIAYLKSLWTDEQRRFQANESRSRQ